MVTHDLASTTTPLFSIIIAAYNDWESLDQCLQSLAQQAGGPTFEVIIADDGSTELAPEFIRQWQRYYHLTIDRQPHSGISTARNRGAQLSRGSVLVFVDADSRVQTNCLAALNATITGSHQHNSFQLRLVGDCRGLVGRAEQLRLLTIQNHMIQPNGCIRYLNTAGFAIRRSRVDLKRGIFDPVARRAEDTLLLSNLMQAGELPFFVHDAIVQHATRLSLMGSLRKSIRSAYLEGRTYEIIAWRGVRIRVSQRERLRMLWSMWKTSGQHSIGRAAWFVLVAKQGLQRIISIAYRASGLLRTLVSRPREKASSKPPSTTSPTESDPI